VDKSTASKSNVASASGDNQKAKCIDRGSMQWTEKYRPKVPNDIVGNQSMVSGSASSYVGYLYRCSCNLIQILIYTGQTTP
jgi:hypothetical protein